VKPVRTSNSLLSTFEKPLCFVYLMCPWCTKYKSSVVYQVYAGLQHTRCIHVLGARQIGMNSILRTIEL
jgi:hypothetical protein